jgi:hypothetical protein
MRRIPFFLIVTSILFTRAAVAQSVTDIQRFTTALREYEALRPTLSSAERAIGDRAMADMLRSLAARASTPSAPSTGVLSRNPYLPGSTSSVGSQYDPASPANPYGQYGSAYGVNGARNKYTTGGLDIIGTDGRYLGKLNSNPYDPNSVANPYGQYGSPYSPNSINNPYSQYGSPYSPNSARNPYATDPPKLYVPNTGIRVAPLPPLPGLPPITP